MTDKELAVRVIHETINIQVDWCNRQKQKAKAEYNKGGCTVLNLYRERLKELKAAKGYINKINEYANLLSRSQSFLEDYLASMRYLDEQSERPYDWKEIQPLINQIKKVLKE